MTIVEAKMNNRPYLPSWELSIMFLFQGVVLSLLLCGVEAEARPKTCLTAFLSIHTAPPCCVTVT